MCREGVKLEMTAFCNEKSLVAEAIYKFSKTQTAHSTKNLKSPQGHFIHIH